MCKLKIIRLNLIVSYGEHALKPFADVTVHFNIVCSCDRQSLCSALHENLKLC